jgi:hypothetical protein
MVGRFNSLFEEFSNDFIVANINKLGHEDHIPGQVRDWNEELQITKELPKKSLPERLIRERAMFKVELTKFYIFKILFFS